jgi:hypothetical protein
MWGIAFIQNAKETVSLTERVIPRPTDTPGADFSYIFFRGKFWGKIRGKFSPKNVVKNGIFRRKKFRKIIFPRNSKEFSAESYFPCKKMCEKSAPALSRSNF